MKKKPFLNLISLMLIIFILGACSSNEESNSPVNGQNDESQTSNTGNSSDDALEIESGGISIEDAWASSAHASNYVSDSIGNNNNCAQCHSPINFMPSMDDIPESCLTCKFEIADPEPFIPEADWLNIPCKTCHKLDKKDNVEPEIFWLAVAQIDEYDKVSSADEICLKCHISTNRSAGHPGTNLAGVHADYLCIECHDPHSTATEASSCGGSECHDLTENDDVVIVGHDEDHQNVSCSACHDSGDFAVKPNDEGIWVTYISKSESTDDLYSFTSHNIILEVDCGRCHYPDNPWDLSDDVIQ